MRPCVLTLAGLDDAQELAHGLDGQAHRLERAQEQPVGLLRRDQLGRDDRDLLAVRRDGAGQQELLAGDRRDPGDEVAELGVGLEVQLHDPLARRELLAGVEVLVADQLGSSPVTPVDRRAGGVVRRRRRRRCRRRASASPGVGAGRASAGVSRAVRSAEPRERRPAPGGVRGRRRRSAPGGPGADSPRLDPDRLSVGGRSRPPRAAGSRPAGLQPPTATRFSGSSSHRML